MSEEDSAEKEHEPSQHKLDEARKRGDLVRSADLTSAAAIGGFLLAAAAFGPAMMERLGTAGATILSEATAARPEASLARTAPLLSGALAAVAPFFVLPMGAALLALIAQQALVFAPEKLEPKLARIDPIANAKQKFGLHGLVEFAKSGVKLVAIGALLAIFLARKSAALRDLVQAEPAQILAFLGRAIFEFVALYLLFALVLGGFDFLWQRHDFLKRNRMSRQELIDEMKHSEGDPHIKAQRRQKAVEIATRAMLADVPKADVVIVNPTHYAVALKWSRGSGRAPVCVAKGVDAIALKIREIAQENGVPIRPDPPTARILYATVDIGQEIAPEHYKPVAAAIRFAERIRQAARRRR